MRILQVAPPWLTVPPLRYGGIEWIVSGLADGLVDAGHEVTLLASGGSKTRAQLETVFHEQPFEQLGDARIEAIQALTAYRRRGDGRLDVREDRKRLRLGCQYADLDERGQSLCPPKYSGQTFGSRQPRHVGR